VIGGDREKVHGCVRALRTSLVLHNLVRSPFRSALAVVRHYASEIAIRYSPKTLETVCILSPGNCDETTIIEALMPILQFSAVTVEKRYFWPQLSLWRDPSERNAYADREAGTRESLLVFNGEDCPVDAGRVDKPTTEKPYASCCRGPFL